MTDKEVVFVEWLDSKGIQQWEYLDEIDPCPHANAIL
jgi:hypothetical protein